MASRLITAAQGKPTVEESFLTGLIHDLGLLVERQVFPKKIAQIIAQQETESTSFCAAEQALIGADHQAFGMALATKWRFPITLCTAIGYHHKPMDLAEVNRELPVLVKIADVLACKANIGFVRTAATEDYDDEMLGIIKLSQEDLDDVADRLPEQVALTESMFSDE